MNKNILLKSPPSYSWRERYRCASSKCISLRYAVLAQRGNVETYFYPEAKRAFNAHWSPNFSETVTTDSNEKMFDFLKRNLKRH